MKRGIRKVRQAIKRRKQNKKSLKRNDDASRYSSLYLPDTKARHGYSQSYVNHEYFDTKKERSYLQGNWLKGIGALLLFLSLMFILQTDHLQLKKPKQITYDLLNKEFPFAKVNDWYVETFGHPFGFLPESNQANKQEGDLSLPVNGDVTEPFNSDKEGIMITPNTSEPSIVSAFDRGIVIFAGNDRDTKKTVIIQHPDDRNTTYGFLSSVDVHLYQPIQAGSRIGTFSPSEESETVYFSVEENNNFVDPIQVIKVDNHR